VPARPVRGISYYNLGTLNHSISVIIPAYNEERRLAATLNRLIAYFDTSGSKSHEILIVDDGSTDSTAAIAEDYAAKHPCMRVLRNPGNRGKGYSVRHGMLEASAEWALFTDADLSSPIEELEKLSAAAQREKAQVAIGSRAVDRSLVGVHQSFFREFAGRLFNLCMRLITGLPISDTQCGFKLFEARAAREVFRRQRIERFGFDAEALFIARRLRFRIVEVPVRWNNAEGTKVTLLGGLTPFGDLLRIRWNAMAGRYR
jgi:dolichyl-phosphate beta-glucosyltransferase